MKNFCLYNGKKIEKLETWDITSVELSSDYTSAIVQVESKVSTSQHTLDMTPLISNQYKQGLDVYSSGVVNELTGVSDWVLDSDSNRVKYFVDPEVPDPDHPSNPKMWVVSNDKSVKANTREELAKKYCSQLGYPKHSLSGSTSFYCDNADGYNGNSRFVSAETITNPAYNPNAEPEREEKYLPLDTVAAQVISNAGGGDTTAQNSIVSTFNNITDGILDSDYSEFFEANKQPK